MLVAALRPAAGLAARIGLRGGTRRRAPLAGPAGADAGALPGADADPNPACEPDRGARTPSTSTRRGHAASPRFASSASTRCATRSIPLVTVLSINVGFLFSATVVVENVFQIPGLGSLLVQSVLTRDYPVIQGARARLRRAGHRHQPRSPTWRTRSSTRAYAPGADERVMGPHGRRAFPRGRRCTGAQRRSGAGRTSPSTRASRSSSPPRSPRVFAPLIAPYDPNAVDLAGKLLPPSVEPRLRDGHVRPGHRLARHLCASGSTCR